MIKECNIRYISKEILNQLQNADEVSVDFKTSKDGFDVPFYKNTALHSTYYPFKECNKIKLPGRDSEMMIAVGFGAGYHLAEASKIKRILCVPVNTDLLNVILGRIDISYIDPDNFKIISADELALYFDFFSYSSYSLIIHPAIERMFAEQTLNAVRKIKAVLSDKLLEINTYRKFGRIWFVNILKNVRLIFEKRFNAEPLVIDKKPILIAGAGPSLSDNIDIIKRYRDKFYIASSDTGLKVLIKNGIAPDAVFSFDCQQYSLLHFTGIKKSFRIFTDMTSPLRFNGCQTPLSSNHPFMNLVMSSGLSLPQLPSDSRNIGGAVIDFFLKYFYDYPLVTAGIDYGIKNNYLYSRGTYLDEYGIINAGYFKTGEDINAGLLYRHNFTENKNGWKTDFLLKHYASSVSAADNVMTLSDSPFCVLKRPEGLEALFEKAYNNKTAELRFDLNKTDLMQFKDKLISLFTADPGALYSYFISLNIKPSDKEIKNTCLYIEKALMS